MSKFRDIYVYREEDDSSVSVYKLCSTETWFNEMNTYTVCGLKKISGKGEDWESLCAYIMTESVIEALNANDFYYIHPTQYEFYGIKEGMNGNC